MKPPKHIFLENILTEKECDSLNSRFFGRLANGWRTRDGIGTPCMGDPFKYFNLNSSQILKRLTQAIKSNYPEKIKYSHSFLRLYKNGNDLKAHTDRYGLDITLTINIGGLTTWPIHISNLYSENMIGYGQPIESKFLENFSTFLTPKGCGVVCYAGKYPHWRDELVCTEEEYVLQLFYHWTIIE